MFGVLALAQYCVPFVMTSVDTYDHRIRTTPSKAYRTVTTLYVERFSVLKNEFS